MVALPGGSATKTATVSMVEGSPAASVPLELSTVAPTKPGRAPTTAELGELPRDRRVRGEGPSQRGLVLLALGHVRGAVRARERRGQLHHRRDA